MILFEIGGMLVVAVVRGDVGQSWALYNLTCDVKVLSPLHNDSSSILFYFNVFAPFSRVSYTYRCANARPAVVYFIFPCYRQRWVFPVLMMSLIMKLDPPAALNDASVDAWRSKTSEYAARLRMRFLLIV